jgi:hypothetical protein
LIPGWLARLIVRRTPTGDRASDARQEYATMSTQVPNCPDGEKLDPNLTAEPKLLLNLYVTCHTEHNKLLLPDKLRLLPEWPEIEHLSCVLFGHPNFTVDTFERLHNYITYHTKPDEHGKRDVLAVPLTEVATLLRAATPVNLARDGQPPNESANADPPAAPFKADLIDAEKAMIIFTRDPSQSMREVARKVPCAQVVLWCGCGDARGDRRDIPRVCHKSVTAGQITTAV